MKLPAALKPDAITAVIDTREQTPLDLSPLRTETTTLSTGDHHRAGRFASRILYTVARRRWRELRTLAGGIEQ